MIREINKDIILLAQPSVPATAEDVGIGQDLADTLLHHQEECAGMAANMIGELKRIIVFFDDGGPMVMYNPVLLKKEKLFETEEGCLSLTDMRKTKRYRIIKVQYQNEKMQTRIKTYTGWIAQVIQHEMDHLDGIII